MAVTQLLLDLFAREAPDRTGHAGRRPVQELRRVTADFVPEFVKNRRARRYIVRVQHNGRVRVTIPRHGNLREARLFLENHRRWVEEKVALHRVSAKVAHQWRNGTTILWRGVETVIQVQRMALGAQLTLGTEVFLLPGGTGEDLRAEIEACLRDHANGELRQRTLMYAATHGVRIRRITVRSQRSRWGSCSASGSISLNWRLLQAPPRVRDYVILHELMHTRVFNHSARFWDAVERVCPDYRRHEAWIKEHSFLLEA